MRVLLINQVYYPDVAATAQHADDLARHLVRAGHDVHVIASRSIYGGKGATLSKYEEVDGVRVHRVGRSIFGKAGIAARAADFAVFYVLAMFKALTLKRFDVAVCFTTPPFISLVGWVLRTLRGTKFVYWVMDMYPDVPVVCGVMKEGALSTRFFEAVDRFCLRRADRVVVLGRCMRERVLAKGADPEKVEHIGVWSDQSEVKPIGREHNEYTERWGLDGKFVVMYSGNFGLAHDVRTMLEAAERLESDDRFRFLFVGGGKKKAEVEAFVQDRGLTNAVVDGYQPREKLDHSLSCPDVHLATMIPGAEGLIVPCKLFGIMAAGRPTVFIGSPKSELALVLRENGCGEVVEPGEVETLVEVLRGLADDPGRVRSMGERARAALSDAYGRETACEAWRRLLEGVAGETPIAGEAEPEGVRARGESA